MNDFIDILVPLNSWLQLHDSQGRVHWLRRYYVDRWGNSVEVPLDISFAYAALGSKPPLNDFERIFGGTRLGSLMLRFLDWLGGASAQNSPDHQVQQTRTYLTQLRDSAAALNSDFLVLLIPRRDDIGNPSELYVSAVQLMQELDIPYMSLISALDAVEDYATPPDGHWNNSGHQKVGALLSACMADYSPSGDLADCDNVIMP